MIENNRNNGHGFAMLIETFLNEECLVSEKLTEELNVIFCLMFQENEDFNPDFQLFSKRNGKDHVCSAAIWKSVFFRFELFPIIGFQFLFGKNESEKLQSKIRVGV